MKLVVKIIIIPIVICIAVLGLLGYLVTFEIKSIAEKSLNERAAWIAVLFDADVNSMEDVFSSGQKYSSWSPRKNIHNLYTQSNTML